MISTAVSARPARRRADVDADAFDADLLARVRSSRSPRAAPSPRAVVLPVAAGVTVAATAAVMFVGGPGDVGGPSSAAAITQALHWLDPPDGTILHARSVETQGDRTTTREFWQSADDPTCGGRCVQGAENSRPPATRSTTPRPTRSTTRRRQGARQGPAAAAGACPPATRSSSRSASCSQDGDMTVTGRELHDGVEAWVIWLRPDAGRPVWTLWVSAADGKPLELRDPGRDASERAGHPLADLRGAARRANRPAVR